MRVSQKHINKRLQKEILGLFYQLISDLKTPQEAQTFLDDILGRDELTVFAKRISIAHYLDRGRSYENIKNNLKVSSATIASIDKIRNLEGYQLALKKVEAERWASEWAEKIEKLFKKN